MMGAFYGAAAILVAALVVVRVVMPRLADAAFARGDVGRARTLYRVLRTVTTRKHRRVALDVSLAGCLCAAEDFPAALAALEALDLGEKDQTPSSARAAWLNNRAYAGARTGRREALGHADEAVALRPDVPALRHTRGVALLAAGRLDDAIAELDGIWSRLAADTAPLLEAERCHDLGVAWLKKGERDYAEDYFRRALSVAPGSRWATRSAEALKATPPARTRRQRGEARRPEPRSTPDEGTAGP
jgi:tetratricopeptide (TPR) repeat protein